MSIPERQHASKAYDTIEAARRLVPTVARRAPEIESARRIPHDLLDELVAADCFRVLTPTSHGGLGADLPSGMKIFETLARADASVGWTVMIGGTSWIDLVGLPRVTFDELFASSPNVIFAGVFSPSGSISAVKGGYRVAGRWSFASGCEHAYWLFGNNVEGIDDGVPCLRMAVFSPDQAVIEDTWNVSGLSGTGSHHFHVDDVFVPAVPSPETAISSSNWPMPIHRSGRLGDCCTRPPNRCGRPSQVDRHCLLRTGHAFGRRRYGRPTAPQRL